MSLKYDEMVLIGCQVSEPLVLTFLINVEWCGVE